MNQNQIIDQTAQHVREALSNESSGHDWWHIYRVWNNAKMIAQGEEADMFIVELAALLHDIADWKFHGGDEMVGAKVSREWLEKLNVDAKIVEQVCDIVATISFKGAGDKSQMKTLEGKIVQDADRLDAIGAIGIARTFAYGGAKGREMYNPEIKSEEHSSSDQYFKNTSPTINHFYEKLLLLKDLMNTKTARKMALGRHKHMEEFLKEFYSEWEGKL